MHAFGVSTPHTAHCLADGNVMISTMGDRPVGKAKGNAKGDFIIIDMKAKKIKVILSYKMTG